MFLIVTPCVGVWIETSIVPTYQMIQLSHPAWVCGLKPALPCLYTPVYMSHPAWVCGLKLLVLGLISLWKVTPCVGVWIETCETVQLLEQLRVTPCVGVWIETFLGSSASSTSCHTLRGCVDWNGKQLNQHLILHCHTLRGCVDWNFTLCNLYYWPRVTPCVGVWIETIMHPRQTGQGIVTPCVGVWIETYSEHIANVQKGHTLRGCVDWNWEACAGYIMDVVTPCVGVWIETMTRWIRV